MKFRYHLKGKCRQGSNCPFLHRTINKKQCFEYTLGLCKHGRYCQFSHDDDKRICHSYILNEGHCNKS